MITVGLTGNIGSGKSMVAGILAILGIPVYHADDESKKFLDYPDVIERIRSLFGPGITNAAGHVDRQRLATIVFSDAAALQHLNTLLHPLVLAGYRQWCLGQKEVPYVVMEAAIIYESGIQDSFDRIIHVSCPKEIAIGRVIRRDRTDGNSVENRMRFQMDDEVKSALADHVVRNDGATLIIPQVLAIHRELLQAGPKRHDDVSSG
jgi:dephospho-CoA kinase